MFGVWIMIWAGLSAIVTVPFGYELYSGFAFGAGMLFAWASALFGAASWIGRKVLNRAIR